jgi:hypothetical protein
MEYTHTQKKKVSHREYINTHKSRIQEACIHTQELSTTLRDTPKAPRHCQPRMLQDIDKNKSLRQLHLWHIS